MSLEDFKMVLDDLRENSIFFVHLSGGEPFLHPEFVKMVDYACSRIGDVSILTNGTAVSEEHLEFFRDITKKTPIKMQVSIDSIHSEINRRTRKVSTEGILKNIRRLSDAGVLLAAGMVVTNQNIDTLVESILVLREQIKYFHIMCIQDTEHDPRLEEMLKPEGHELSALWDELDRIQELHDLDISKPSDFMLSNYKGCAYGAPCAAAFTYLVIDPDLNLRPCDKLNSVILGNMRGSSLRAIWNSATAERFLDNETPLCMSRRVREVSRA
jgi:MoaA/NifB/PqqE/SkfB family radical SAM enzyme